MPPIAGPTKLAVSLTDPSSPPARTSRLSSSPTSEASTRDCDELYAGKNAPTANATATITGNESNPVQRNVGMSAMIGAQTMSARSIVRRGPSAVATRPLGMPRSVIPRKPAAMTVPIRAGDPVVTRTNHGRATAVTSEPVVETTSARRSPTIGRFRAPSITEAGSCRVRPQPDPPSHEANRFAGESLLVFATPSSAHS